MWRREDEFARITGKWMQWDLLGGTCCWPDSVYTHFFSLSLSLSPSFFWRTRIEFLSISFFSLLTGDSISLSSSFQLSKWTNQSPLTSLFFLLARSPRALSFLVSVASSSFAFFYSRLSYAPIHPFEFFFFAVSSFLDVTHLATKNTRARQTRWMNARSEPVNREAKE